MSGRWYNKPGENADIIPASRIRLLRNFKGYAFPQSMNEEQQKKLFQDVEKKLSGLDTVVGTPIEQVLSQEITAEERLALKERMLINKAVSEGTSPFVVYAGEDEAFSMTVNGQDHLRLLYSASGQALSELYTEIDRIDDYIGGKMPYAFDRRLGFKTSTLQNVGTGMRAYYVMHLPLLSEEKTFAMLQAEIGKYGVVIKDAWGIEGKAVGGLYVLYNQRTLGLKESDIIEILSGVSDRLLSQERELRQSHVSIALRDRVLRSYGTLSYALRLDLPEACRRLSDIMLGVSMGTLSVEGDFSCYELMLGVFPGNLQVYFNRHFGEEEMKIRRAEYLKKFLKQIRPIYS